MGALLCDKIRKNKEKLPSGTELIAIGTNSAATAAMLKAGADFGATGENPVLVACRDADFIIGPLGIMAADSLLGEVTPPWRSPWEAAGAEDPASGQSMQPPCGRGAGLLHGAVDR